MINGCAYHAASTINALRRLEHGLRKRRETPYLREKMRLTSIHFNSMLNECNDFDNEIKVKKLLEKLDNLEKCVLSLNLGGNYIPCIDNIPIREFFEVLEK